MAKNKELFAPTLNGITASVKCMSSIIVVLNAKLTRISQELSPLNSVCTRVLFNVVIQ